MKTRRLMFRFFVKNGPSAVCVFKAFSQRDGNRQPDVFQPSARPVSRLHGKVFMPSLRQKLLVLYGHTSDLNSRVVAWAAYDGTGKENPTSGDSDRPPYPSVVAAMRDGWRVIQFTQQFPAYPGMEYTTSYLRFEYILEKMEDIGE